MWRLARWRVGGKGPWNRFNVQMLLDGGRRPSPDDTPEAARRRMRKRRENL